MLRRWLMVLGVPALILGTLVVFAAPASAQRFFGRGGYYGNSWGYPGYYGYGNNYYWSGYNSPWNYGYNSSYAPRSYSWGYYPSNYYYSDYEPNYYYGQQPMYTNQGYTSFYNNAQQQPEIPKDAALVEVRVPPNAEIWFGGEKTQQTGTLREFVTPELKQDKNYHYDIRARWNQNGQEVEQTRRVRVSPGAHVMVDFFRGAQQQNPTQNQRTNEEDKPMPKSSDTPAPATNKPAPAPTNPSTPPRNRTSQP